MCGAVSDPQTEMIAITLLTGGGMLAVGVVWWRHQRNRCRMPRQVEMLKNALLTLALMRVRARDRDDMNMRYDKFDGTKLPMLSGCDLSNACFSYIVDRAELRRGPWYTRHMEYKVEAIERYLGRNLATDAQAQALFDDFVASCVPAEVDSERSCR